MSDNLASKQASKQASEQARNRTLDIYKGLLIILVVIRHVLQYSVTDEGGILTNIIWAIQMPGFMLVSGYFSVRKIENMHELSKRIVNLMQHYSLPFLSWWFLINVLLLGGFDRNVLTAANHIAFHVDSGMWFLWVVFILSIVVTICNYISSRNTAYHAVKTATAALVMLGILGIIGILFGIRFIGIKFILYYSVFYGSGYLLRKTQDIWKQFIDKYSGWIVFIALICFATVVFNNDLYHCEDDFVSIALRCIAGFSGNIVLLWIANKYKEIFERVRLDRIGLYTLEIYTTHMYVNGLMGAGNTSEFFTVTGFANFTVSLILTIVFTVILTMIIKSIPYANFLLYGKRESN